MGCFFFTTEYTLYCFLLEWRRTTSSKHGCNVSRRYWQLVLIFLVSVSLSLSLCSLLAELQTLCKEFHKRISLLEADKYDLEWKNKMKSLEVIGIEPWTHWFTYHSIPISLPPKSPRDKKKKNNPAQSSRFSLSFFLFTSFCLTCKLAIL